MNVGSLKTLSYLTSFGFLGGIGYIGYDYYENGRNVSYFDLERAGQILNGVQPPAAPKPNALDYKGDISPAIVDFDWTGKPPPVVRTTTDSEVEGPEKIVKVEEILEVIWLAADEEDPSDCHCLVRFIDSSIKPRELFCHIGDTLPAPNDGVSVLRIFYEGVEFSFDDESREPEKVLISMRPDEDTGLIAKVAPGEVKRRSLVDVVSRPGVGRPETPLQTEMRNGQFFIGTEDAQMWGDSYADILSRDVKTKTYFKDGKRAGVELTEVREGSIVARHGGQSGDVIISINGNPVSSEQEAIAFAKNNSERYSVWEVEVLRFGRVETVVYHSPRD